ncbi:transporter [candidate division KSB1 bacterium]
MVGAEYSFNHFTPSDFNETPGETTPKGEIDVQSFAAYALYGLNDKANLILIVPFEHWRQEVNVYNNHMRTGSISGIGDVTVGARWLIKNNTESMGHRFFAGVNISIPTGDSFDVTLFTPEAVSKPHNHFAIGKGHFTSSVNLEWWHRLEMPILTGVTGSYSFPLNESDVGLKSGKKFSMSMQATVLKTFILNGYPYFRLNFWHFSPDLWKGNEGKNSGGRFIDGSVAFVFNLSESLSLVSLADFPLWRNLEGNQLDNFIFSLSFRKMLR